MVSTLPQTQANIYLPHKPEHSHPSQFTEETGGLSDMTENLIT